MGVMNSGPEPDGSLEGSVTFLKQVPKIWEKMIMGLGDTKNKVKYSKLPNGSYLYSHPQYL